MSLPNFIHSNVIRGLKILKLGHVTQATLTFDRFMVHMQEGSVLYVFTKFESDSYLFKISKLGHLTQATPT